MPTPVADISDIPTAELSAALEEVLGGYLGAPRRVVAIDRRPPAYWSSHRVELIDAQLDDGRTVAIFFKQLGRRGLVEAAAAVKPAFVENPAREIAVYREILGSVALSTAAYHGSHVDPAAGRYWLFLERVAGSMLSLAGELDTWLEAARWLGTFHARMAGAATQVGSSGALLTLDAAYCRTWLDRARMFVGSGGGSARDRSRIDWLAARYDRIVEALVALPRTILHGEFYPSNVLVQSQGERVRICPVDWEMAAIGPGLIDLAALTGGQWTDAKRSALCRSYQDGLGSEAKGPEGNHAAFREALDLCRIQLAVQWLGWSAAWVAPSEHRQDWLGEAVGLAEGLGL